MRLGWISGQICLTLVIQRLSRLVKWIELVRLSRVAVSLLTKNLYLFFAQILFLIISKVYLLLVQQKQ